MLRTLSVLIALALLTGCEEPRRKSGKPDAPKNIKLNVTTGSGTPGHIEAGRALPSNYAEKLPEYPGGKVSGTVGVGSTMMLQIRTSDPVQKVAEFFQKEIPPKGWQITSTNDFDQIVEIIATREGEQLKLNIAADGPTTIIAINITAAN